MKHKNGISYIKDPLSFGFIAGGGVVENGEKW
jgi:hypothetical protein